MVDKEVSVDGLPEGPSTHEDNRLSPAGAAQPNIKVRKTLDATDSGSAFATVSQRYVRIRPALWVSTKCFDRADIDREMTTCETRDGRIACFVGNVAKINCCLLAKEHTEEVRQRACCGTAIRAVARIRLEPFDKLPDDCDGKIKRRWEIGAKSMTGS